MGMLCCKLKKEVNEESKHEVREPGELGLHKLQGYRLYEKRKESDPDKERKYRPFKIQSALDVSCYLNGLEENAPEVKPVYPPAPPPPVALV